MFAYCNNNPVLYSDRFGTIPYNDSWLDESFREAGRLLYEFFTGRTHPDRQAAEINDTIIVEQNEFISDAANDLWDAYIHYNTELQPQLQYNQDMAVIKTWDVLQSDPLLAIDVATGTIGTGTTYVGVAAAIAGVAIPIGGQIILGVVGLACGLWGLYRVGESVVNSMGN